MTRPIRHDTIPRRARRTLYKADQLLRRPPPTSGAYYEIAVFYDEEPVTVDRTFTWPIPLGVNGLAMIHVEAGLTAVVGSSATIVQLHNVTQAVDMLSTPHGAQRAGHARAVSTSFGQWQGVPGGATAELIDNERFRYLCLQFRDDVLIGATAIGLTEHVGVLRGLIEGRVRLGPWKDRLLADPQLVMDGYLARAQAQAAA